MEHVEIQPTLRGKPIPVTVHGYDTPEAIERTIHAAEITAQKTGTGLRVVRSSGRSMVSMHGISEEQWNKIKGFGKKKK